MIYFAQQKNGSPIRIGCTTDIGHRVNSLGSWVCGGVEIIATIPGGFFREQILLDIFKPIKVDRDWFSSCPTMWRFILEEVIGGTLDWLPMEKGKQPKDIEKKLVSMFGSLEAAMSPMGYSSMVSFRVGMNYTSSRSYNFAAKLALNEMLRSGRMPRYLRDLHVSDPCEMMEAAQ